MPGAWRQVQGGSQWVGGFWQNVTPPQQQQPNQPVQPEIEYLPPPPQSIELGPTVPAPTATSVYIPGSWVWRGKYKWRPGVWVGYRPEWIWVPARFHWTPAGYVFCEGYWDYPLAARGVLFAPVAFRRPIYAQPAFVYTPAYVVSAPCMVGALFVRRGHGNYYFGDYFGPQYATGGYSAWCGTYNRNGFSIGFGVGRSWGYDPLWTYYAASYRSTPAWGRGVGNLYQGRYRGDLVRPPTTLVQQNTVINNITRVNVTNVTNNITVVNGTPRVNNRDVSNVAMVAPLKVAPALQRTRFQAVNAEGRRTEAVAAKQLRDVGVQRTKLETAAIQRGRPATPAAPGRPAVAARPATIKLDVPKAAVVRAQVRDEKKAPPPNPHRRADDTGGRTNPGVRPTPKVEPRPTDPPRPVVPPVGTPTNPRPKVEPPRVDPRPPVNPPVRPQPKVEPPKVEPRPRPKYEPRPTDPPRPVVPPVGSPTNPRPKYEPRPPVNPVVPPRGTPPRVDPPKGNPKERPSRERPADPPRPVVQPQPRPQPAPVVVNPPRFNPKPVVQPQPRPVVQPRPQPQPQPPRVQPRPVQPPRAQPQPPRVQPQPRPVVQPPRVQPQPPRAQPPRVQPQPRPVVQPPRVQPRPVQPPRVQPQPRPSEKPKTKPVARPGKKR